VSIAARSSAFYLWLVPALLVFQAAALLALGRVPICECGTIRLWTGAVQSAENSQQIFDWYSFTHITHGVGFYFLTWLLMPRAPIALRFAVAVGVEAAWEVIENTSFVIERYRAATISVGYYGDSIINSIFDTVATMAGFVLAYRLPIWLAIGTVIAVEAALAYLIRDNLFLNIIMLIHPVDAIRQWQSGA
jgi:hypothetical protein